MLRLNCSLVDDIVQSCLAFYEKLPKTGKPVDKEWTVLSCVVQYERSSGARELVALGTGTKCVGARDLSGAGVRLSDSHAEVVARRAFLRYLYHHVEQALANQPSIFKLNDGNLCLKPNVEFIFYSSQLPCGDASIIPKCRDDEPFGDLLQSKRPASDDLCPIESKRNKVDIDVHRTGAKCLKDSSGDPKLPGLEFHLVGAVRTKPGRGDPTLSMSCSDKMARWVHVGLQGALLHSVCGRVHIKHFIFGGGVPYSEETLNRALLNRKGNSSLTLNIVPEFYQTSLKFPCTKTENNTRPAPGSIIWTNIDSTVEVAVRGKKLGLTKTQADKPKHALSITKYKLYLRYLNILKNSEELKRKLLCDSPIKSIPYNEMKKKCVSYYKDWAEVREKFFGSWTVKPDLWSFLGDPS